MKKKLAIIVPCFNEASTIKAMHKTLSQILAKMKGAELIDNASYILSVDDGSTDESKEILEALANEDQYLRILSLSKNFGHQLALIAGMDRAANDADMLLTIDCDMQQDPLRIPDFVNAYYAGADVVLGVRRDRKNDGIMKTVTAAVYHWFLLAMKIRYQRGHSDYRLVSKNIYKSVQSHIWVNQFLRSTFSNLNCNKTIIYHDVSERKGGVTKYTFPKMMRLAIEGFFSNAHLALRFIGLLGLQATLLSMILGLYVIICKLFFEPVEGWSSLLLVICFFGGITIFCQSLMSEVIIRVIKSLKNEKPYKLAEDR